MSKSRLLTATTISTAFLLALTLPPSVTAFQATLGEDRVLRVTHGAVLGDEDRRGPAANSGQDIDRRGNTPASLNQPRPVLPNQASGVAKEAVQLNNREVKLKVEEGKGRLEVRSKNASPGAKPLEKFEDRYVRLELSRPASPARQDIRERAEIQQQQLDQRQDARQDALRDAQEVRQDGIDARQEDRQEFRQELRDNRQDRRQDRQEDRQEFRENFVIQTPPSSTNPGRLELESQGTRAPLPSGAEVTVDPSTTSVTVTGPNGQSRVLNNLPDQAFERIRERLNVAPEKYDQLRSNLVMRTNDDGTISYVSEITEQRRAFGFIPVPVKKTVSVDDQTGQVSEQEQPINFWGRLLGRFAR